MVILIEAMPPNLNLLAGTTRLELANQLIENQPAFHFAFIPIDVGYGGRIRTYVNEFQRLAPFRLGHSVIWWTWHDLNVRPRPSQSRALIPLSYRSMSLAEATGVEPARAMRGDVANRCHTIRRRLH